MDDDAKRLAKLLALKFLRRERMYLKRHAATSASMWRQAARIVKDTYKAIRGR